MGKISDKKMLMFISEFADAVFNIGGSYLLYENMLRFGHSYIYLEDARGTSPEWIADDVNEEEEDLIAFCPDEECEGYLTCEGELYEKMYGYEAYGKDVHGDGDQAKRLYDALNDLTEKYGMWYEWFSGAIGLLADNKAEHLQEPAYFAGMDFLHGKNVHIEIIKFSFYFSSKKGKDYGIRVYIKWDRDKFLGPEDGYMNLYGDYEYVQSEYGKKASDEEIEKARDFFKRYKILFAAVWEEWIKPSAIQSYLMHPFYFQMFFWENALSDKPDELVEEIRKARKLENIEKIVRERNLFDMND